MSEITELVERFRSGGDRIAALMSAIPGTQVDRAPAPGKWSIRQILCHLADTELIAGDRIRRILAEDNPALIPFDPDAWATKLDYQRRDVASTVEILRMLRLAHAAMITGLPEEAWARSGTHTQRGRVTLLDTIRTHANHVENHARQIETVRKAFELSGQ